MPDTAPIASPSPESDPQIVDTASEAFAALMRGEFSDASSNLILRVAVPAAIALVAVIVTYFVAKLVSRWVANSVCAKVDQTLGRFCGKLAYYTIMLVAILTIMQTADIGVTSFAAIMAAAGFAIGLAFQGTLSNFASGILLLVFRPFKVGDVVNAAGVTGKVNEIDLFTTTLDTPDNRRLIVPNSAIAGTTIENITYHPQRRVDVVVGVGYGAGIAETRNVLAESAESLSEYLVHGEGRGYQIVLSNLGGSSVDWTVRFWTTAENYFTVKEALTSEIKQQLDIANIEIPFPQMQVHLGGSEEKINDELQTVDEQVLPVPKMNLSNAERPAGKIRPRARGSNLS